MTKSFLVSLGWDPDKIYNVGGYWYYDGKNNVEVNPHCFIYINDITRLFTKTHNYTIFNI